MPNIKSAKKRLRQNTVLRLRNRAIKSAVKTQMKKVRVAVQAGDFALAATEFRLASKKLDQAAAANTLHKNNASRHKARLSHLIKSAKDKSKVSA
jgi:small subunit ribosomal protein S20